MTSVDASVMVARMQALGAEISSLGPALEQAAPSGEFANVLSNANAVLAAASDPAAPEPTTSAAASSSAGAAVTPSASLLGLAASGVSGSGDSSSGSAVTGTSVVADAEQYLGVPYQWGGTSPTTGFDCSGLVQHVYADLGISLPRTSQEQVTAGTPVDSIADAQPGDLVFFEPSASGPGHVGIYIGNGQMIDAPHTGTDVRIQAVGQPIAIRRILPSGTGSSVSTLSDAIPSNLNVPGDAPLFGGTGALEELGQHGEDRWWITPGGGRLTGRQPDLALRHGEARQGVHHQHDVLALVTEPFGDPRGRERGPDADESGLVGRGDDHDGAGQALRSEVALDEFVDLAAALTDEGDDRHRGVGPAGHHGQQTRLADPGSGEDTEPLTPATGDEGVDGLDAERQLAVDQFAAKRMGRRRFDPDLLRLRQRRPVVDGSSEAVEDAAEKALADPHREGTPEGFDGVTEAHAGQIAERHTGESGAGHGDDLGVENPSPAPDAHRFADGGGDSFDLDPQPHQARDATRASGCDGGVQ